MSKYPYDTCSTVFWKQMKREKWQMTMYFFFVLVSSVICTLLFQMATLSLTKLQFHINKYTYIVMECGRNLCHICINMPCLYKFITCWILLSEGWGKCLVTSYSSRKTERNVLENNEFFKNERFCPCVGELSKKDVFLFIFHLHHFSILVTPPCAAAGGAGLRLIFNSGHKIFFHT